MKRLLVIRRDNIGDLVCTTPLLAALRRHFPDARIVTLVNSYNAPVLKNNPDVDEVCIYRKAKHRGPQESVLGIWWQTFRLLGRLRQERFDTAIVATPGFQPAALKFARWISPREIVAFGDNVGGIRTPCPIADIAGLHETAAVMRLLRPLGIDEPPGPVRVFPDHAVKNHASASEPMCIGFHISARKPSQRWPVERFAELAHRLHTESGANFRIFWSPGSADDPQHPGDDEAAARLMQLCSDIPAVAYPTHQLDQLINGLAGCNRIVCSDGGAMHLAAGLGIPILCFFGNSDATRWHPWGVPHELLQPSSLEATDISVDDAQAAFQRLSSSSTDR